MGPIVINVHVSGNTNAEDFRKMATQWLEDCAGEAPAPETTGIDAAVRAERKRMTKVIQTAFAVTAEEVRTEEREACARLAEQYSGDDARNRIAANIRARGIPDGIDRG